MPEPLLEVLVVDDHPDTLRLLARELTEAGLAVRCASSGEQAIAEVAAARPDAVLLDVRMGGIDGFETCRRLREGDADLPIVFTTGLGETEHVVRGFENPSLPTPPDPRRDERAFNDELLLIDLGMLEKRMDRLKKEAKKGPEVDATRRCLEHLEKGEPLRTLDLPEEERKALGPGVQLLSATPLITLYNLSEQAWADPASAPLREHGLDIDMPSLVYTGPRTPVPDYLTSAGWHVTATARDELFTRYGRPLPPDRDAGDPLGEIIYISAGFDAELSSETPPATAR